MKNLLDNIESPDDLRELTPSQLPQLADELREFILQTISRVGGHLSSNLGVVELTIALHYVYKTPFDQLVWDVGHQTYSHKVLTGRAQQLHTIRQQNGLSGFPRRDESVYDSFGTAHSSTSISAALGMATAAKYLNEKRRVAAIIGDGALSGGMAFEALNNAGDMSEVDLLVVLNDNDMSISPPVGAINNYLGRILASRFYGRMQSGGRRMLSGMPTIQRFARRTHEHLKGMILPGTLFEEFGFNYVGPIDGHDLPSLVSALSSLRDATGPQFLHVATVKGRGFQKAENDPVLYHGVGAFKPEDGIAPMKVEPQKKQPSYAQVFGEWICSTATREKNLVAITPAMREGSGLVEFSQQFPARYFDVGIAEQHALTFAAGLACGGMKPVVAIYSTFLQRGYDQLIHDIALQNLPVVFAIDRAGLVGADGATHHGVFDLSYLRCVPNMTIMTPANENETWQMLNTALALGTPAAVRYPRGSGPGSVIQKDESVLPVGRGEIQSRGSKLAIMAFGTVLSSAIVAGKNLSATVANMRFVKPLDEELIVQLANEHEFLATVEENMIFGGSGDAVSECLRRHGINKPLLQIGLADEFIHHGAPADLLAAAGLDAAGVERQLRYKFNAAI
ncbi:MAG: 1-deoxy-D-xylulose-5-phosphate synthase [Gammaproteobacteria bacterium WSBS_2016_MAG_OTU1]